MRNFFVPYEIALKLKEKGFTENCICYFTSHKLLSSKVSYSSGHDCECKWDAKYDLELRAPLYQQVVDWLRINHGLVLAYDMCEMTCSYDPTEKYHKFNLFKIVNGKSCNALSYHANHSCFDSYYKAFDFIIDEALNLIIV